MPFTTSELVRAAHRRGMAVVPWTVNDRATMESLIGVGVDRLQPARLLRQVMAYDLRLPR